MSAEKLTDDTNNNINFRIRSTNQAQNGLTRWADELQNLESGDFLLTQCFEVGEKKDCSSQLGGGGTLASCTRTWLCSRSAGISEEIISQRTNMRRDNSWFETSEVQTWCCTLGGACLPYVYSNISKSDKKSSTLFESLWNVRTIWKRCHFSLGRNSGCPLLVAPCLFHVLVRNVREASLVHSWKDEKQRTGNFVSCVAMLTHCVWQHVMRSNELEPDSSGCATFRKHSFGHSHFTKLAPNLVLKCLNNSAKQTDAACLRQLCIWSSGSPGQEARVRRPRRFHPTDLNTGSGVKLPHVMCCGHCRSDLRSVRAVFLSQVTTCHLFHVPVFTFATRVTVMDWFVRCLWLKETSSEKTSRKK